MFINETSEPSERWATNGGKTGLIIKRERGGTHIKGGRVQITLADSEISPLHVGSGIKSIKEQGQSEKGSAFRFMELRCCRGWEWSGEYFCVSVGEFFR